MKSASGLEGCSNCGCESNVSLDSKKALDLTTFFEGPTHSPHDLSEIGSSIEGSQILKIAYEIRAMIEAGKKVLNLTVGDFNPKIFPAPEYLIESGINNLKNGQTNYPPSDGVPELREAIVKLYERRLGIKYSKANVVVQSGGRPGIYAVLVALINPGDGIIYTLPSWNNNLYCDLVKANHITIPVTPESGFLPTAEQLAPVIGKAKLICLNSPMNPCGTVIKREQLKEICDLVVSENKKRAKEGKSGVYLMYDQLYWLLTFGETRHYTPPEVCPEITAYTILIDGASKYFASTGLRVGWTVVPPILAPAVRDIVAQMGAWAPKPLQFAVADLLNNDEELDKYLKFIRGAAESRLNAFYDGFEEMRKEGLPVRCLKPEGAIYLSIQVNLIGKSVDNYRLVDNEEIRKYLLEEGGFGVIPFGAFGATSNDGWFRISIGTVSLNDIAEGMPKLKKAIQKACK